MTPDTAVEELDDLDHNDPDSAHSRADSILLELLRDEGYDDVVDAYEALVERCGWWATA